MFNHSIEYEQFLLLFCNHDIKLIEIYLKTKDAVIIFMRKEHIGEGSLTPKCGTRRKRETAECFHKLCVLFLFG